MSARSWFRRRFTSSSPASSGRGPSRRRLRPSVLALEGRTLLSWRSIVNNTNGDIAAGLLRAAVAQANSGRRGRHDPIRLEGVQHAADDHP